MSIGVDTAEEDSFIVILDFLKHICIVFKIHICFILDRNLDFRFSCWDTSLSRVITCFVVIL